MLNRKWYQGSKPEMEFHMINIIYGALSISAQTEKTTFSCKDDCTLTKPTGRWTYSAKDFEIPLCHTPPLRSFLLLVTNSNPAWGGTIADLVYVVARSFYGLDPYVERCFGFTLLSFVYWHRGISVQGSHFSVPLFLLNMLPEENLQSEVPPFLQGVHRGFLNDGCL